MLIFEKGLRIRFWNVRKQLTEGVIKFKCEFSKDSYVVDVGANSCIVHEHQITDVLLEDYNYNSIWVSIDDIYKSFPNGSTITPNTKYNTSLDVASMYPIPDSVKIFAAPCPKIDIEPIKDLSELSKQYVSMDIKASDEFYKKVIEDNKFYFTKKEVEKMLRNNSIKVNNFETLIYSGSESVKCTIELSMGFEEATKLRSAFNNSDRDMADAMAQGFIDYVSKPRGRNSGRYPWVNSSGIKFQGKYYKTNGLPVPKKVIFNGPATIVLWTDNTKTVVKKSEDEPDDREKALMYCVFKKFLDDKKRDMDKYLKLFYKVLEEDKKDETKEETNSSKLRRKKPGTRKKRSEGTV